MKTFLFAVTVLLVVGGCLSSSRRAPTHVQVVNRSTREMSNAEARFDANVCSWGTVIPSATKGYLFFPHPITDDAIVRWWEEGRGARSEWVDLRGVITRGAAGTLTFTVSERGVTADFRKE